MVYIYFAHISMCSQRVKKVIKKIKTSCKQKTTASPLTSAAVAYSLECFKAVGPREYLVESP